MTGLGPGPEFDLIRRFLAGRGRGGVPAAVRVGPGDDCTVVDGIAVSTDLSVEGIHFRREWIALREVGYRAAAVALSDLAAMAARPIGLLASLAVPRESTDEEAAEVMEGVAAAAESVGGVLLGGDLARIGGPLVVDVVVVGSVDAPVLRSGARPGDALWVTGELGGAAACVSRLLRGEPPGDALARFARPVPRTREACWLADRTPLHAMIDLSDGLAGDARHIATASDVAIVIEAAAVPIHPAAREVGGDDGALALALSGGEDYELCFAAPAGAGEAIAAEFEREMGIPLTRIGRVQAGCGVSVAGPDGLRRPAPPAYQHFGGGA